MQFLMFFFSVLNVALDLMNSGTRFHILAESLMNVEFNIWHPNVSFNKFSLEPLVLLSWADSFRLIHFIGYVSECWDFQISNSFI